MGPFKHVKNSRLQQTSTRTLLWVKRACLPCRVACSFCSPAWIALWVREVDRLYFTHSETWLLIRFKVLGTRFELLVDMI